MWDSVCRRLSRSLDQEVTYQNNRAIAGGCIHNAQALETSHGTYFVKTNRPESLPVFQAEARGLKAIKETGTIRCPDVLFADVLDGRAILVLEFITLRSAQPGGMAKLGRQLAAMHRPVRQPNFGWAWDNHIGSTPQRNTREEDWITFYKHHRLEFQMDLCERKGLRLESRNQLLEKLEAFFTGYSPSPSLLHGDLWGGNKAFDAQGEPVVYDPACYYGDREADLAFTEMFGGFSEEFYDAYQAAFPLDTGYLYRKRLYNLYHELNHYHLFGGGYGNQARETVRYLLKVL